MPSGAAPRAPLSFGGIPAIRLRHRGFGGLVLAHFEQVAQSFARGKLL